MVYKFNPKARLERWLAHRLRRHVPVLDRQQRHAEDDRSSGKEISLFATASTTGFDQIKRVDCSADGKTVTYTYATPYSDWLGS